MAKAKVVKINKNEDTKIIEADNIGQNKKGSSPFTAKNIIILLILLLVSIALVALTITFVMNINFPKLFQAIQNGFMQRIGILWFVLLILFAFYSIFMNYASLWARIRKWGYKISHFEYWVFAAAVSFLRAVTPVLFSDPYTIFWLKTKGIPTSKCTSLLFSNSWFWLLCHLFISLPSFIMVLINRNALLSDPNGIATFTFMCGGVSVDVLCIIFMTFLCFNKQTHFVLSRIFNWFKKKLHMQYHTKKQIAAKYKSRATIKRDVISFIKDWKTTGLIVLIMSINLLIWCLSIGVAMYFVQNVSYMSEPKPYMVCFNFGWVLNCAFMADKANRLNFIAPGGEGTIEYFFYNLLLKFSNWKIEGVDPGTEMWGYLTKTVTWNSILMHRTFGSYIPAFLGLGSMIGLSAKQIFDYKKKKLNKN